MWPLSVAGAESARYFFTACDVSPGHVGNWLFSIARNNVVFGGLNKHWCKNWTKDLKILHKKLQHYFYNHAQTSLLSLFSTVVDQQLGATQEHNLEPLPQTMWGLSQHLTNTQVMSYDAAVSI